MFASVLCCPFKISVLFNFLCVFRSVTFAGEVIDIFNHLA